MFFLLLSEQCKETFEKQIPLLALLAIVRILWKPELRTPTIQWGGQLLYDLFHRILSHRSLLLPRRTHLAESLEWARCTPLGMAQWAILHLVERLEAHRPLVLLRRFVPRRV